MKKFLKSGIFYFLILVLTVLLANFYLNVTPPNLLSFSKFISNVNSGNVKTATVYDKRLEIEGSLKNGKKYITTYSEDYPVSKFLNEKLGNIEIKHDAPSINWIDFVPYLIFGGMLVFALMFMLQQVQGGGGKVMSFGKARTKQLSKDHPRTTFKDVAGVDEAVEELQEIRQFLSSPGKFLSMGAKIPKGVLLYGPPGSGKTLLARAVAGEAGVPFFSISGSDFVEMFVGVGASRVRDLFEQAKMNAPSIIFMDEIDAVGRHRGAGLGGGHDEREQTLNQLLVEMDGFDIKDNVILIAATNRPDILDPALLRPGRFDRQIVVDRPDLRGRHEILKVHARNKPLAKNIDLNVIARRTPGFTGADIANLMNEAALLAARHNKKKIEMHELEESIDRVIAGPERKTRLISDKEKEVIAYHEGGHALVANVLPNTDPVHKISIIPRGRALGYTLTLPTEDRYLVSKSELLDELAMLLGGRVAEEIMFKNATTGAQNDLERATKIARKMVCEYGMSDQLGPLTLGQKHDQVFLGKDLASNPDYSQEIAFEIDKEIRRMVDEAWVKAEKILTDNKESLQNIAKALIDYETIDNEELKTILKGESIVRKAEDTKAIVDKKSKAKKEKPRVPGKLRPAES